MYTALYRRYRPKTFNEMVGQEHIVKILKNQIKTGNTAHAYLFCGTRGTGKTSAARIFAKGVNCLSEGEKPCGKCENCISIQQGTFFDVIEIDAASNNRVDNIRELRESVKYPPAAGLCKVYIIDEVHMLSTGAFNALLKTLEEPPEHVIFILATTEPHKLPATILSRCLRLDFRRVSESQIKDKLKDICDEQSITYEESALSLIAANGDGSVRDALSILEQCLPAGEKRLLRKDVVDILGTVGEEIFIAITDRIAEGDTSGAFLIIEKAARDGKDMRQFIKDWTFHFRNIMMSKYADKLEDIMNMSCENVDKVKSQGHRMQMGLILAAITELSAVSNKARYSTQPRVLLEMAVLKLSRPEISDERESLIQRIEKLESALFSVSGSANYVRAAATESNMTYGSNKEITDTQTEDSNNITDDKPLDDCEAVTIDFETATLEESKLTEERRNDCSHEEIEEPDLKVIWARVFRLAEKERASLRILGEGVTANKIEGNRLLLNVESKLMQNMLEKNRTIFEKHLAAVTKREIRIQVNITDSSSEKPVDMEETKQQLTKLLGADKLTII